MGKWVKFNTFEKSHAIGSTLPIVDDDYIEKNKLTIKKCDDFSTVTNKCQKNGCSLEKALNFPLHEDCQKCKVRKSCIKKKR